MANLLSSIRGGKEIKLPKGERGAEKLCFRIVTRGQVLPGEEKVPFERVLEHLRTFDDWRCAGVKAEALREAYNEQPRGETTFIAMRPFEHDDLGEVVMGMKHTLSGRILIPCMLRDLGPEESILVAHKPKPKKVEELSPRPFPQNWHEGQLTAMA